LTISRLLILLVLTTTGACVTPRPEADQNAVSEAGEIAPVELTVRAPEPEPDPLPGACEVLLQSLEDTRPLLSGLDESFSEQTERIEAAIASLNQPMPEPRSLVCPPSGSGLPGGKEIIGAIEWLYMDPPGRHFRARVDSGSETSSLSATDVVEFERDGDDWVRFTFNHDSTDETVDFELPIKRTVLVRQVSVDEPERRFVIELDIRLGDQLQTTEFTLTDRNNMTYPLLLGRAFLMDLYVVDVSQSYTHQRYDAS
jgi:hypothetical protein